MFNVDYFYTLTLSQNHIISRYKRKIAGQWHGNLKSIQDIILRKGSVSSFPALLEFSFREKGACTGSDQARTRPSLIASIPPPNNY